MASSRKSEINTGRGLRVGKIVGFHGLRGDVKVRPASPDPGWVGAIKKITLVLAGAEQAMTVASSRIHKQSVLMRFKGLDSRTAVEPLNGAELYADQTDLPALAEDELYVDELRGMAVVDASGKSIATVKELLTSAGQDFLELTVEGQSDTVLVPYNAHFFPNVDRETRQITVSGLEGFL